MNIIERILPVFQKNYPIEVRDGLWDYCMSLAIECELNEANLENMGATNLTVGFAGDGGELEIVRLAEALGVFGTPNTNNLPPDEILDTIQTVLPFQINFPPFSGNVPHGLQTKYGVASNRHIFYLWVLKRIMELCPDKNSSIIEIGAGFGLLGYYLDKAGYRDYTAIDLALVNACQTYFLARNLPDRNIIISGDVGDPFDPQYRDSIKLLHSTDFKSIPKNRFALMVNMDGLTEYGIEQATKYVRSDCSPVLFSINHEVNSFRVCDIAKPFRRQTSRCHFLLRDGYVEELYAGVNT